jgi:transcriptional regulator with XRE-family HTH domain
MATVINSTSDYEIMIGEQLRRLRISCGMDQSQLASAANISVGAVKNLEGGKGSSLKSLIMVLRTLKADEWLSTLSPEAAVSPMQMLRDQKLKEPRSRVYRSRNV